MILSHQKSNLLCPAQGALSDDAVWRGTSDVCLSVAYIGPKSRTETPRKTKIGTEVTHVIRDSDTTFNVKRSKVKVTRPLWLVVPAGQHGHTVMVTFPDAYMTYIVSPLAGQCGAYRGGRPPTACYKSRRAAQIAARQLITQIVSILLLNKHILPCAVCLWPRWQKIR